MVAVGCRVGKEHQNEEGRLSAPFPFQPGIGRLTPGRPRPYRVASVALIWPQVDGAVWGGAAAAW
jgi:hypothetical protein